MSWYLSHWTILPVEQVYIWHGVHGVATNALQDRHLQDVRGGVVVLRRRLLQGPRQCLGKGWFS